MRQRSRRRPFPRLMIPTAVAGLLYLAGCGPTATDERSAAGEAAPASDRSAAADSPPGSDWVRIRRDAKGNPVALQTAIVRYVPEDDARSGFTVDLIGSVHVADAAYYDWLNRRFEIYDALLYELVAPPGHTVPLGRDASSANPVGALQNFIKGVLELEHQLAHIDYQKANFIHADMSPDEFAQSMADRDESVSRMIFQLLGRSLAQQHKLSAPDRAPDVDLLAALFAKDRALQLKMVLAEQFEDMELLLTGFGGADGSTLIEGRNAVALRVLGQQIRQGRKKIGVFYGAGHLADMDQRVRRELGLKPIQTVWVTAWDLCAR